MQSYEISGRHGCGADVARRRRAVRARASILASGWKFVRAGPPLFPAYFSTLELVYVGFLGNLARLVSCACL